LLGLILALAAPFVWARAGGGHSYSGGGYSGGGGSYSGGGGSGGGDFIILWWMLVTRYPAIGWPVTLFLLYLTFKGGQKGQEQYVGQTIRRGMEAQVSHAKKASLEKLRARDPGFEERAFLLRVKDGFIKTQDAWARQDMRPVRAFLSDGVFERFDIYLAMQKALGFRNAMEQVEVLATRVLQVESDDQFDAIHVRVDANAVDYDVQLEGGRILRNEMKRAESFTEVWSFLRRPGAKTLQKPGLMEGACPNCGAPLKIADAAKCANCDSWVNSGEYDWVLSEITQSREWKPLRTGEDILGKKAMTALDPGVNTQFLEDRASVAFWRWQIAHWEDNAESLGGVAAPEMVAKTLESRRMSRVLYKNAAVGGVETVAFEPGEPLDRAHVLVRWSGEKFHVADGQAVSDGQAVCSHVFIFARKHGVKTDPRGGLRSTRCPNCGAPPSTRAVAVCEYCSTPFNDGSRSWTLVEIQARGLWKRPSVAAPAGAPAAAAASNGGAWHDALSPDAALAILVAGMVMDGKVEKREVEFARGYARKNAIPENRIEALVASAQAGTLEVPNPRSPLEAANYMRGLIDMSLADGVISGTEQRTLVAFGERMKLSKTQVNLMVNKERARLYREAKAALRGDSA
jgi:hypothetical protein